MRNEPIHTAHNEHTVIRAGGYRAFVQSLVSSRTNGSVIEWDDIQGVVYAEVIRNVWCVKCPYLGCNGALVAELNEPFFCPDCMCQENDFKPSDVIFPNERAQIEALLVLRPIPNRNWQVGEPLANLQYENDWYLAQVAARKVSRT